MGTLSLHPSSAERDDAVVAAMLACASPGLAGGICAAVDHLLGEDGDNALTDDGVARLGAFRDALRGDA